jgi:hypothetical protein
MKKAATNYWKRIIIVAAVAAVFFVVSAPAVFAAETEAVPISADLGGVGGNSLKLVSSNPEEGSTNLQAQNVGIKLYFDGDVTDKSVQSVNEACFAFTYKSGGKTKTLPVKTYFETRADKGHYILAIIDTNKLKNNMLVSNKAYNLTISGRLTSADGRSLGRDTVIDFKTVDQSSSTSIYMLLMVGMIGAMIAMTVFQSKRKEKAAAEVAAKGGRVNPYKLAKDKKISVKEAMELIERDRKRRMKRLGIAEGKDETTAAAAAEKPRDTKRVKAPRPISAAGSTYKTGRSALVERRAQEAIETYEKAKAAKKSPKSGSNKGKSKNKKKKK